MIIGVPKEICPGEQRVAITPANVSALLKKQGVEIIIERGAGDIALGDIPLLLRVCL